MKLTARKTAVILWLTAILLGGIEAYRGAPILGVFFSLSFAFLGASWLTEEDN